MTGMTGIFGRAIRLAGVLLLFTGMSAPAAAPEPTDGTMTAGNRANVAAGASPSAEDAGPARDAAAEWDRRERSPRTSESRVVASSAGNGSARVADGIVRYSVPFMAPTPCHVVAPGGPTARRGGTLVVRRTLSREPGMCAQVMTEVVFEGAIPVDDPPDRLIVRIVNIGGAVLAEHAFDL
jgi:hypothetical protein